jgi:hypothetical protein
MKPSDDHGAFDAIEAAVPAFLAAGMAMNAQGNLTPDDEHRVRVDLVYRLKPVLETIMKTHHDLFTAEPDHDGNLRVKPGRLGKRFLFCLRGEIRAIFDQFPNSKFNPYFEAFLTCVNRSKLVLGEFHIANARGGHVPFLVDHLNRCVDDIRQVTRSFDFRRRLRDYRRPVQKNYESLMQYIGGLFGRHSRLMIIRLDLAYKEKHRRGLTPEVVIQHRQALLNALNAGMFGLMRGYASKLEMGRRKGYHNHWLLFFDGDLSRKDTYIAMQIGQYWDQVVTDGIGSHYNCNARKDLYKKNCFLGIVHHTDPVARKGLETFAAYITKSDELFKLSMPGVRSFWKGQVSEPLAGPRPGRPRARNKGDSQWPG